MALQRPHKCAVARVLAWSIAAMIFVPGCGGGSGDTSPVSGDAPAIVSGSATKGPLSGATVSALSIVDGSAGTALASATTDAQGGFRLSIEGYAGPLMLRISGGTYLDEATGFVMHMGAGDVMTAVLTDVQAGQTATGVQVTPLTSMAQAMAQNMAGGMATGNIAAANAAVGRYFMVDDILRTQPMNPLAPASGSTATQSAKNYGMTLAAMSQYAKNAGIPVSSAFITSVMADASDGMMDGTIRGSAIMIAGMMGGGMMQPSAGTSDLASAMMDFVDSSLNRSGVAAADMAALMQKLGDSDGSMN